MEESIAQSAMLVHSLPTAANSMPWTALAKVTLGNNDKRDDTLANDESEQKKNSKQNCNFILAYFCSYHRRKCTGTRQTSTSFSFVASLIPHG